MYEKILAAIDDSEVAHRVLTAAEELARLSGGEVWLVHVWEAEPAVYKPVGTKSFHEAELWLETAAEKLGACGITAHAVMVANLYVHAARDIAKIAAALEVNVILVGSHGRNSVAELLNGSTAHKVVHLADRPVLVLR
jgi:nucleotide-binding universal stress UspA family protein